MPNVNQPNNIQPLQCAIDVFRMRRKEHRSIINSLVYSLLVWILCCIILIIFWGYGGKQKEIPHGQENESENRSSRRDYGGKRQTSG